MLAKNQIKSRVVISSTLLSLMMGAVQPAFADTTPGPAPTGDRGGRGGAQNGGASGGSGGGPRPSPTASPTTTPTATPTSTPTPTASATPVAIDTTQARNDGLTDGRGDGAQEGRENGARDGVNFGEREGYREGLDSCTREEAQRNFDLGYHQGSERGNREGDQEGANRGYADGQARGIAEGRADGQARADRDALRESAGPGADQGNSEANASDATDRGRSDGTTAGDRDARNEAIRVEYARGHADLYKERYAQAAQSNDSFSQRPEGANGLSNSSLLGGKPKAVFSSALNSALKSMSTLLGLQAKGGDANALERNGDRNGAGGGYGVPGGPRDANGGRQNGGGGDFGNVRVPSRTAEPEFRYSHPRRTYGTTEENSAYQSSYKDGYRSAFQGDYATAYDFNYRQSYRQQAERGCDEARRRDYRESFDRGFREGRDRAYREAYDRAYSRNTRLAYDQFFGPSSKEAYDATYPGAYNQHFEEARQSAYRSRVNALYNAAFNAAHDERYAQVYDTYARQEYARGRKDEAADFAARPVRLESAEVTETILNGLYEPGEPLRVKLALRNFADQAIAGRDVKLALVALDANSAVITQAEASLVKDLRARSMTTVSEALEFRMSESAVNRARRFKLVATFQGRAAGEQVLSVTPKFMIDADFAEAPTVKDGLASTIKLKITNQSQVTSDAMNVHFVADTASLVIAQPDQATAPLAPGESRVLEYTVTAHTASSSVSVPMAFSVTGAGNRRIGLLDTTESVPVVNDYRVTLATDASALRNAGVTRLVYRVQNTGSRLIYRSLQLTVRFKDSSGAVMDTMNVFSVIGPNPQFLWPMERGETVQFIVPVLSRTANAGGTVELELAEDGRTVVIHDVDFAKTLLN